MIPYYSLCILPVIIPGLRATNSGHVRHDCGLVTSFLFPRQTTERSKSLRRCDALLLSPIVPPEVVAYTSSLRAGSVDGDGIPPPPPASSAPAVAAAALVTYSVLAGLYLSGAVSGYPAALDLGPAVGRDVAAGLSCAALATVWVKIWTSQVNSDGSGLDPKLCRKIIHTTSAPLFMLTWPLFLPPSRRGARGTLALLRCGSAGAQHAQTVGGGTVGEPQQRAGAGRQPLGGSQGGTGGAPGVRRRPHGGDGRELDGQSVRYRGHSCDGGGGRDGGYYRASLRLCEMALQRFQIHRGDRRLRLPLLCRPRRYRAVAVVYGIAAGGRAGEQPVSADSTPVCYLCGRGAAAVL